MKLIGIQKPQKWYNYDTIGDCEDIMEKGGKMSLLRWQIQDCL